VFILEI